MTLRLAEDMNQGEAVIHRLFIVLWVLCVMWAVPWFFAGIYWRFTEGYDLFRTIFLMVVTWIPAALTAAAQFIALGFVNPIRLLDDKPDH